MLDHVGVAVADLGKSKSFYNAALRPLAIALLAEVTAEQTGGAAHAGYGEAGKPFFWIDSGAIGRSANATVHVAFTARSRAAALHDRRFCARTGDAEDPQPSAGYDRGQSHRQE